MEILSNQAEPLLIGGMYKGDRARKENLVNYGFRLPSTAQDISYQTVVRQRTFAA